MRCAGSVALEAGKPDTSSSFADEGTAAHLLASAALEAQQSAAWYTGWVIVVHAASGNAYFQEEGLSLPPGSKTFTVDAEKIGRAHV